MNEAYYWCLTVLCVVATLGLFGEGMYRIGVAHGAAQKVCAKVEGEQVVSTSADVCHYAKSYGRAIKRRAAI